MAGGRAAADTVVGGHERVLRQTVIGMLAGSELGEHENPGEATVHVLRGRVRLSSGQVSWEGRAGDLLKVPDARHSLHVGGFSGLADGGQAELTAKLRSTVGRPRLPQPPDQTPVTVEVVVIDRLVRDGVASSG